MRDTQGNTCEVCSNTGKVCTHDDRRRPTKGLAEVIAGFLADSTSQPEAEAELLLDLLRAEGRRAWFCADKFRIYRFAPSMCKRAARGKEFRHRQCGWHFLTPEVAEHLGGGE